MASELSLESYQQVFSSAMFETNSLGHNLGEGSSSIQPLSRLKIYRNNYRGALTACMLDTFRLTYGHEPTCLKLISAYIDAYPSVHENLNLYGDKFSHFLMAETCNKTISQLAHYEYARQCCYYADNNVEFPLLKFNQLSEPEKLNHLFVRQDSIISLVTNFDLLQFIETEQPLTYQQDIERYFLLYRDQGKVNIRPIEYDLYRALEDLKKPNNLHSLDPTTLSQLPILISNGYVRLLSPSEAFE